MFSTDLLKRNLSGQSSMAKTASRAQAKAAQLSGKLDGETGLAAGLLAGVLAYKGAQWLREEDLRGQVAVITGASRGLGFLLARELAKQGCKVAICARDAAELERARLDPESQGAEVFSAVFDVSDQVQVERFIAEVTSHFGQVDALLNVAGVIQAGPMRRMTVEDFHTAMAIMYWGVVYPTLAVLPQMMDRRRGKILNVASIGGKVAIPHLTPYSAAKFATTGFSEGMRAEMAKYGVTVTTICPGLMRTGSHLNAYFKGGDAREFGLFSPMASLPGFSMDAERAARQIVQALKRGDAERTLSLPATLLARFHGLFPGLTADILGMVSRVLPDVPEWGMQPTAHQQRGMEIQDRMDSRLFEKVTAWGMSAAERFHQLPGPGVPEQERERPMAATD
jgi:NAD(P)-dependent dehydrogenase (short-subunit alcohol dehydrogenase family)